MARAVPAIPAERPFHSLSYPDIDYTVMRPAALPPPYTRTTRSYTRPGHQCGTTATTLYGTAHSRHAGVTDPWRILDLCVGDPSASLGTRSPATRA